MEPEDSLELTPGGKVYIVPMGANVDEVMKRGPRELRFVEGEVDWGFDEGPDLGLGGGLEGRLDGALSTSGWTFEMELAPEAGEAFLAALMGKTVEEYRDLVKWARESRWLKSLTGLNWGTFE